MFIFWLFSEGKLRTSYTHTFWNISRKPFETDCPSSQATDYPRNVQYFQKLCYSHFLKFSVAAGCKDIYERCDRHKDKCSLPKDNVWFKWVSKECQRTCKLCSPGIYHEIHLSSTFFLVKNIYKFLFLFLLLFIVVFPIFRSITLLQWDGW